MHRQLNLSLLATDAATERLVDTIASYVRSVPGPLRVIVSRPELDGLDDLVKLDGWEPVFQILQALRRQSEREADEGTLTCVGYLTARPDERRWFIRSPQADPTVFLVHADDYEWLTAAPGHVVLVHLLVCKALVAAYHRAGGTIAQLPHPEQAAGCAFDLCAWKPDLEARIRIADVCANCLVRLENVGVSEALLRQAIELLDRCRADARATRRYVRDADRFRTWPYPVAVTRHRLGNALEPSRQKDLLLDFLDATLRFVAITQAVRLGQDAIRALTAVAHPSIGHLASIILEFGRTGAPSWLIDVYRIVDSHRVPAVRNDDVHGWCLADESEIERIVEHLQATVAQLDEVLAAVLPLLVPVVVRSPLRVRPSGDRLVLTVERMAGSNLLFDTSELVLPGEIGLAPLGLRFPDTERSAVFLPRDHGRGLDSLWPFARMASCSACRHESVLLWDGPKRVIDARAGHRAQVA